jgi:hypothetical protein
LLSNTPSALGTFGRSQTGLGLVFLAIRGIHGTEPRFLTSSFMKLATPREPPI